MWKFSGFRQGEVVMNEMAHVFHNLISCIEAGDWFSAFAGFGSALLVEAIVSLAHNFSRRNELLKDLKEELSSIKVQSDIMLREYSSVIESGVNEYPKLVYKPYHMTVWESACNSGELSLLDSKSGREIIRTFTFIQESNELECLCFNILISHGENELLNNMMKILLNNRKDVNEKCIQMLGKMR